MREVGLVLLLLISTAIALEKFCTVSAAGEGKGQAGAADFTATLREHNTSALVSALEKVAKGRGHLTPEEASLLLAASLSPPKNNSPLEGRAPSAGMLRGDPEQKKQAVLTNAYASLGDTLVAARGVADKAGKQLSEFLGLQSRGTGLLQWWKENGAAAVEAAMTSLFGPSGAPPTDDNGVRDMEALLAALQQQQEQKEAARSPGIGKGAPEKRTAAPTPESSPRTLPWEMHGKRVGHEPVQGHQDMPSAVDGPAADSPEDFRAAGTDYTAAHLLQPLFGELERNTVEGLGTSRPIFRQDGQPPIFSLLGADPTGKSLEELLQRVAGALGPTSGAIPELYPPFPGGLPSMRFSAMSILTEGGTWKNWTSLVKLMKQRGHVELDSPEAQDVMQKLAVVLACAYKTAKTFLGEEQAISMIRAAIRQNADFREQIYSAVRKNLEGADSAGDSEAAEGSGLFGKPRAPDQAGEMDIEGRVLRELLLNILRMPPRFFDGLSQKYRTMLGHWGVSAAELEGLVKGALLLKSPLKKGVETSASPSGGRLGATSTSGTSFNSR